MVPSFAETLEVLATEIRRRAFEDLRVIDQELSELGELRAKASRLLSGGDLLAQLDALIGERCARREAIAGLIVAPEPTAPEEAVELVPPEAESTTIVEPAAPPTPVTPSPPAPPAPPAKKKPTLTGPMFARRCKSFFQRERVLSDLDTWNEANEAEAKALLCECRALIEAARELDQDPQNVWQSFQLLKATFNRCLSDADFFALNTGRIHSCATWSELGEAFGLIPVALEGLNLIEREVLEPQSREELLIGCAAVESWIYRILDERGAQAKDVLQERLHRRVESLRNGTFVPWWTSRPTERRPTEEVRKSATALPGLVVQVRGGLEKQAKRELASQVLEQLREAETSEQEFETSFLPAVLQVLESGTPPSNKDLVYLCMPFRAALAEVEDTRLTKLVEYIRKTENKLFASSKVRVDEFPEPDEPVSPEYANWLAAVREKLSGKTVMFMGGKRQPKRIQELEREFSLKELLWPDGSPRTTPEDLRHDALRADVVCYLIRWSRHGYKQILDLAKAEGKATATFKAGLGTRRLVHDLYHQLCAANH